MSDPPPNRDPSVSLHVVSAPVTAGAPFTVAVDLDEGTTYEFHDEGPFGGSWIPARMITYSGGVDVRVDGATRVTDQRSLSGSVNYVLTITTPGDYELRATGR